MLIKMCFITIRYAQGFCNWEHLRLTPHLDIRISLNFIEHILQLDIIPEFQKLICLLFPLLKDEKVDSNDLKIFLGSLGIELTDQEKEKLLKTLPIDGEIDRGVMEVFCWSLGLCKYFQLCFYLFFSKSIKEKILNWVLSI